jgi:RimJ/RimL family protein N-acetyltransferase
VHISQSLTSPYPTTKKSHQISYLPYGPFPTFTSFLTFHHDRIHTDPNSLLFLVTSHDSRSETQISGLIGLLNASPLNQSIEIGHVIVLPRFQGTYVSRSIVSLLVRYLFEDLGMRRVQWQANEKNEKSVAFASKFGFRLEGQLRWDRVLRVEKGGLEVVRRRGGEMKREEKGGRHTMMLALTWEDWEGGLREEVERRLEMT